MEENIKELLNMIRDMEKVYSNGKMEDLIEVAGNKENNTEEVSSKEAKKAQWRRKENGKKVNLKAGSDTLAFNLQY